MKFSLIGPVYPYRGGIAHYTTGLAEAITSSNHEKQIISYSNLYPSLLYPGASDKEPDEELIDPSVEYLLDWKNPLTWKKCLQKIKIFNPDLVAIQWWTTFWALPYTYIGGRLKKNDTHVTYIIHNTLPHEPKIWDPWLARYTLKTAKTCITLSTKEKKRLEELVPSSTVHVCHLPIIGKFQAGKLPKEEAKDAFQINRNCPVLLFFGIVRPYKGLRTLISAMAEINQSEKSLKLIVAGEFWEDKADILAQIESLNLSDQIIIHDRYIPNDEVPSYFSAADVLVAPYAAGTQSGVIKIGLAYGLPIVLTDLIAEGIEEPFRENLFIIQPGNKTILAKAIKEAILRSGEITNMQVSEEETWIKTIHTLESIAE